MYHKKSVSTVASGVDNSSSMEIVIAKKKEKKEKKSSLNWEPKRAVHEKIRDMKNKEKKRDDYPDRSKTRKGGLCKS